jgi:acetyl esterase
MNVKNLHPTIRAILQEAAESPGPPMTDLSPTQARDILNPILENLVEPGENNASVEEIRIPGPADEILIRIYTPDGRAPFPALVYFHGGGYVIGTLDTNDSACHALANGAKCVVVSVDYRLAPEHKFPAAVEDAYAAVKWVADHASQLQIDPNRLAVGGDSAGGTLATVVSVVSRDKGTPPLMFQLLVYPATNLSSFDTDSYRKYAEDYFLKKSSMKWFRDHYLTTEQDRQNPLASPLLAPDLSGLPPAFVITAEFDILVDEGKAYAERLKQAGVSVTYRCYEGLVHLFWGMVVLKRSENGIDDAVLALCSAFAEQK